MASQPSKVRNIKGLTIKPVSDAAGINPPAPAAAVVNPGPVKHIPPPLPPINQPASQERGPLESAGHFGERLVQQLADLNIDEGNSGDRNSALHLDPALLKDLLKEDLDPADLEDLGELGVGNGGVVHLVNFRKTSNILARKIIHLEVKQAVRMQIIRELQTLKACNAPNIVEYFGAFLSNGDINILMEYMDCGSLDLVLKKAGRIPEPIISKITFGVLTGLIYLREKHQIIHRDVKPSNILVNRRGEVKLCDFGVSGQLIDSMANSFVGTRSYMAPERLNGCRYSVSSDIWSLGLSLLELAIGRYPIPPPPLEDITELFGSDPAQEHLTAARDGLRLPALRSQVALPGGNSANGQRSMSIFELLEYIVNEPPPQLPARLFGDDCRAFVHVCLQKAPSERTDLNHLIAHSFVRRWNPDALDLGHYLRRICHQEDQ